jgi:DNA polymerase-3 subunit alpha
MFDLSSEFREFIMSDDKYLDVYNIALSLEGLPRQTSIHAAGMVIANDNLNNILPVLSDNNGLIVQYDMNHLENLGLLKMDLLGLRNLTIIDDCLKEIKRLYNKDIDLNSIDFDDPKIYKMICDGRTSGLFQLESEGMKKTIKIVNPKNFDDVASVIALFRPGPRDFIEEFTLRKNGKMKIEYPDKCLEGILKSTYGIIVYQEQILQVATTFAGFSLAKADILRRAMSKKEESKMLALKEEFINGSILKGHTREKAEEVFALILKFASYGFNKAHTVSYTMIAIQMAYLKVYYPSVFFACVMESFAFGEKFSEYIKEAKELGISLMLPCVNSSGYGFKYVGENKIGYGLFHIKGINGQLVRNIIKEAEAKPFESYIDFVVRMSKHKISDSQLFLLIDAGALDCFGYNRQTLKQNYPKVSKYASMITINSGEQLSFDFDLVDVPVLKIVEESNEKLSLENETLGYYISEFPLENIRDSLNKKRYVNTSMVNKFNNKVVRMVLMVKKNKIIKTKKNELMSITTMLDEFGSIGAVVFPSLYKRDSYLLNPGNYVIVEGKIEVKENISIVIDSISPFKFE